MREPHAASQASVPVQKNLRGYYDVGSGVRGARTDDELVEAIIHRHNDTVLVKYGSKWCTGCQQMLQPFISLSKQFKGMDYVIADVENMNEAVRDVQFSPHFAFFRSGRKVDEFHGKDVQKLRDRIWLHHGETNKP